jgi:hypothetical protein
MTDLGQKQDDFRDGNQRHASGHMASRKPAHDAAHEPPGHEKGRQLPRAFEEVGHGRSVIDAGLAVRQHRQKAACPQ